MLVCKIVPLPIREKKPFSEAFAPNVTFDGAIVESLLSRRYNPVADPPNPKPPSREYEGATAKLTSKGFSKLLSTLPCMRLFQYLFMKFDFSTTVESCPYAFATKKMSRNMQIDIFLLIVS